ncbi:YkgJ family cysteine cluster protein [Thermodesulfobium sp.]
MPNMDVVDRIALDRSSKFTFSCNKGISCWNLCCRDVDILLTPYDVLEMRTALGQSSEEFLQKNTKVIIDPKTAIPMVQIMLNPSDRLCVFSREEGCSIYQNRPLLCRTYPIGMAALRKKDEANPEDEFFFFIREKFCKGFSQGKEFTVGEWLKDQRADYLLEKNTEWLEFILRRNVMGVAPFNEKEASLYFMSVYDLDKFRKFVFDTRFLGIFEVSEERIELIKRSDEELLKFGIDYLFFMFRIKRTLVPKGK